MAIAMTYSREQVNELQEALLRLHNRVEVLTGFVVAVEGKQVATPHPHYAVRMELEAIARGIDQIVGELDEQLDLRQLTTKAAEATEAADDAVKAAATRFEAVARDYEDAKAKLQGL